MLRFFMSQQLRDHLFPRAYAGLRGLWAGGGGLAHGLSHSQATMKVAVKMLKCESWEPALPPLTPNSPAHSGTPRAGLVLILRVPITGIPLANSLPILLW